MTDTVKPQSDGLVSFDRVRARYDIKAAILRELAALPADKIILESDFRARCAGGDANRFRKVVENNEELFAPNRIRLQLSPGEPRWYWGQKRMIEKAAELVNA